jgi:hypothetical protein
MTPLEAFQLDTKTKGYMDQDKLIKVLTDFEARLAALEQAEPYTPSEAH